MTREPAEVTFVGNEGVVLSAPGATVAIDALFGHGARSYTITPDAVIDAIEAARAPFDGIDVAVATHFHPDHFNPRSVARHLRANPRARLVTTHQALRLLEREAEDFSAFAGRVHAVSAAEGARETLEVGPCRIETFGLSHGRVNYADVEHAGVLVHAGGYCSLHLGDGIIDQRALSAAGVFEEEIDIGFLPFWYLTYPFGIRLVRSHLRIGHIFAVHIPPDRQEGIEASVAAGFPRATPLVRPMSQYRIE